jgi:cellulose synthase/poly-beta-1,6-N-acetylglucosamine synthase-like glycosyltransferase
MWLLHLLFLMITLTVGWILFGYFLFLWIMGRFNRRQDLNIPDSLPAISIIIPCLNEADQILNKLKNIKELDYPPDLLEIIIADGGSTDGTLEILRNSISVEEPIRIVKCPCDGKINQINYVLPSLKGEIIVNTDSDARLSPEALKWIAAEFDQSTEVGVVGAYCRPANTLDIERYYWSAQNKGRFMENDAKTSSIVVALCYAFRKDLVQSFPVDVVADDIYIAFLANTLGYKTVYTPHATAMETRSPKSIHEFIPHKFRKSNAFLRESMRFIYRLPEMDSFCKMMLLTRISQQILLPWMLLFWILLATTLLSLQNYDVVILSSFFLILLFVMTSRIFSWVKLPDGHHRYPLATVFKGFAITTLIMLATGISYPFFKQGSKYMRVPPANDCEVRIPEKDLEQTPKKSVRKEELESKPYY